MATFQRSRDLYLVRVLNALGHKNQALSSLLYSLGFLDEKRLNSPYFTLPAYLKHALKVCALFGQTCHIASV